MWDLCYIFFIFLDLNMVIRVKCQFADFCIFFAAFVKPRWLVVSSVLKPIFTIHPQSLSNVAVGFVTG